MKLLQHAHYVIIFAFAALFGAAAWSAPLDEAIALYAKGAKPDGDALLKKLRADPSKWGPALLAFSTHDGATQQARIDIARAFIYYGQTMEEVNLAAEILGKASFVEIDRSEWLYLCQKIAQREVNAMPCARKLLDEPSFFMPLLGGNDGVGKDYALAFLLFQMPEQLWNREVGDRLWRGSDNISSQIAMLTALFYAVSLRGDAILAKYADDNTRPAAARSRANALLTQMSAMERNASVTQVDALRSSMKIPKSATEEDLRALRRKAITQVSRHALIDFERYTFLVRAEAQLRWKERLRKLD
jgi:hypothetical protein